MRFALVSSLFVAGMALSGPAMAADGTPTFTKDVAPIFYRSCVECHRPTMFAPMSLTSYEDARPYLRSIKRRVMEQTMPPWGSDMAHGVFRNDPRLTDEEVQTIVSWIDGGAPKGDVGEMPKMPALADGWTIGRPNAVYSMTEDFKIPATGAIEYQYIRIPMNLPEDRWFTAIEIKPSARGHVHHAIAYTEPSSDKPTRPGNTFGLWSAEVRRQDAMGAGGFCDLEPDDGVLVELREDRQSLRRRRADVAVLMVHALVGPQGPEQRRRTASLCKASRDQECSHDPATPHRA